MSQYWSRTAARLTPYVPGEQPADDNIIKLNTNENPYPPSGKLLQEMREAVNESLKLYPDPNGRKLSEAIARNYNLEVNQVFVGNGSDEILAFAFQAFFDPGLPILFPDITYSFYSVYADLYGLSYTLVPLDDSFRVKPESFGIPNGGIILPNPNAPTAIHLPLNEIRGLLDRNTEHVMIVDEAYIDFGGESAVPLISDYPNLLVVHTFSKSRSLAGLRVGYAMGHPDLIEGLNRIKNSFNSYTLDRVALAGAEASILDTTGFREHTERIIKTREETAAQLASIGFQVTDSKANFLFITHPVVHAKTIFQKLREKGILVRYFDKPRINNYLRVSIGTDHDMRQFIQTLETIMNEGLAPEA